MWLAEQEGESATPKASPDRRHQTKPKQTLIMRTEVKTAHCAGGHLDQLHENRIKTFIGKEVAQTFILGRHAAKH